jgi:drug/metabolite transporter (DMT)-like permease
MTNFISSAALFGLSAAICWGFGDLFVAKVARKIGSTNGALLVTSAEAIMYAVIFMLFLRGDALFTAEAFWYALIGSVSFGFAQAMFYKSMGLGPVGLVSAISSTYPLVALIVGVLLFGAVVSAWQFVGVVLIVVGVMFASGLGNKVSTNVGKGPVIAFLPALGWGMGASFIIHAISLMSWQTTFLIELVTAPLVLVALTPFIKGKEKVNLRSLRAASAMPVVFAAAILEMGGLLLLNLGLNANPGAGAVVVAVSSCYPVLVIFLALRHLKEQIPLIPLVGGVIGVAGVVILSLG